jgi:hypothetical protein
MKKQPVRSKSYPVAIAQRAVQKIRDDALEAESTARTSPFLSFRYSYTEISAAGPTARVKSRTAHYENGKLASETFEGDLDRGAYDTMLGEAHRRFAEQTAPLLRAFFPFIAGGLPKKRSGSE